MLEIHFAESLIREQQGAGPPSDTALSRQPALPPRSRGPGGASSAPSLRPAAAALSVKTVCAHVPSAWSSRGSVIGGTRFAP